MIIWRAPLSTAAFILIAGSATSLIFTLRLSVEFRSGQFSSQTQQCHQHGPLTTKHCEQVPRPAGETKWRSAEGRRLTGRCMRCCTVCPLLDSRSDSDWTWSLEPAGTRGNLALHSELLGWAVCLVRPFLLSSTLWELDFQMSCDFDWAACSVFSQTLLMSLLQKVTASG